jgi:hypothetical protein
MTNIEKKTQMTAEYNKYEKKQTNDNRIWQVLGKEPKTVNYNNYGGMNQSNKNKRRRQWMEKGGPPKKIPPKNPNDSGVWRIWKKNLDDNVIWQ